MANWLRNVQSQLQELASEVLNEATQEVEDPESELQVERKKCAEAERASLQTQAKCEELQRRVTELEDQLYSTNVENDAIKEKFEGMIRARDEQIKQYRTELERLQQWGDDDSEASDNDAGWSRSRPTRQRSGPSDSSPSVHLQDELRRVQQSHTDELSRISEEHRARLEEQRLANDRLVADLQRRHQAAVEDAHQKLLQAETECAAMTETNEKLRAEMERIREKVRAYEQEISEKSVKLAEIEASLHATTVNGDGTLFEQEQQSLQMLADRESTIEHLKAVNNELTVAYNELHEELEKRRSEHGTVMTTNSDLVARIDSLKANLIEYEERYELCKQEHAETVRQLEKLTSDFEQLRTNVQVSRNSNNTSEELLNQEVHLLREALQQAKSDRDQLRSDVHSFRESVSSIDNELNVLRERNQRLSQENAELSDSLRRYESVRDTLQESNGELASIRTRLSVVQEDHRSQVDQLTAEKDDLAEKVSLLEEKLKRQRENSSALEDNEPQLRQQVAEKEAQLAALQDLLKQHDEQELMRNEEQERLKNRIVELESNLAEREQEILRFRAMPDTTAGAITTEDTSEAEPSQQSRKARSCA
ncbi:viral A-type inclusion protein repeat containing protein [Aphelenchoides avenae]|nr:viral A-type inclusion protein repeat containing protein [Aphelenchus avenae]